MSDFRQLSETFLASPQVTAEDIAEAAALGVTLVVNNRPDGESPDQPPGAEIERAARAAGLDYLSIPIDQSGFSREQFEALAEALDRTDGKTLGYCRSGTRSIVTWSLAEAASGAKSRDELVALGRGAGYDLSGPLGG